jgi:hypothetical protein
MVNVYMSLEDLLAYVKIGKRDPHVVREMGFPGVAEIIGSFGEEDSALLIDLIVLAQRPPEMREPADKAAGRKIFRRCCPDEALRSEVDEFYKENDVEEYK